MMSVFSGPSTSDNQPKLIFRHRVESVLAKRGFGTVFLAYDEPAGRG